MSRDDRGGGGGSEDSRLHFEKRLDTRLAIVLKEWTGGRKPEMQKMENECGLEKVSGSCLVLVMDGKERRMVTSERQQS